MHILWFKLSCIIHIPDSKPTTVPTPNHKLRIYHPMTLWCSLHQSQAATLLRGIEYALIHLHQCINNYYLHLGQNI